MATYPVVDPLTELHEAIEGLLRPYFSAAKWRFQPVPSPMLLEEFKALGRDTPWIGLAWREWAPTGSGGRQFTGPVKWQLLIATKNPDRRGRFLGDAHGPGLYPSIVTAIAAINGRTIGDHGTVFVTRAGQVAAEGYADMSLAIGAVEFDLVMKLGDVLGESSAGAPFARLVSAFEVEPDHPQGEDYEPPTPIPSDLTLSGEDA